MTGRPERLGSSERASGEHSPASGPVPEGVHNGRWREAAVSESEQEPHGGGEQEPRPVGGVEGAAEQEVAQGEQAREREREVKAAEAERSDPEGGTGG